MPEELQLAFVNEKTGKVYRITNFDQEKGQVTMVGPHGVEFTEKYDKTAFQNLGYKLQQVQAPAADASA